MALLEKKLIAAFYAFWLVASVVVVSYYGLCPYTICHLYFILIVPLIGLWMLFKNMRTNYVCVGVLLTYGVLQILYLPPWVHYFLRLMYDV